MAKDIAFKITVETDVADMSIGELRQGFRQLSDEMKGVNVGTEEYRKKLLKLGEVKGALKDLKEQINALDPEKRFAAFAKLGSTVASGFAAAQGAMALFGSESEDLQRVLVRVQAAMALAQGLQGLQGFEKSLNIARMALIAFVSANPIMAIVGAITALSAGIVYLAEKWRESNSEVGKMEVAIEKLNKVYKNQKELISEEVRVLEAYGDRQEEVLKKKRELIVIGLKEVELTLFLAQAKQREAIEESNYIDIVTAFFSPAVAQIRRATRLLEANEEIKIQKEKLEKLKTDLKISFIEENVIHTKQADERNKLLDELKPDFGSGKDTDPLLIIPEKLDEFGPELIEGMTEPYTIAGKNIKEVFAQIDKDAKDSFEYRQALVAAELSLEQAKWNGLIQLAEIGQQLAGKNRKLADTFFVIEKALAIAQIVVNTQKEIAGYWSNPTWSLMPDGGASIKTAATVAAKIRAATSIASIVATSIQRFIGGGAGAVNTPSASVSTPNIGGGQQIQAQQLVTGSASINSSGTGFNPQTQEGGPMRAYVVETDITSTQKTIRSIQERTTF